MKRLSEWTAKEMEELYNELGSYRKCAKEVGTTHPTWIKHYKEKISGNDNSTNNVVTDNNYIPKNLDDAIQQVQDSGYFVTKKPLNQGYTFDLDIEPVENNTYKIGVVSDTHLCSKYQQLESLWKFYETCDHQGITTILHAGDLSDGMFVYPGHIFELFIHGEKTHSQYIIDNYPNIKGIDTILIGGNHDESFWKKNGSDICYDVSVQRPDMLYKGFHLADFNINNINICLHHGDGGVAYARSYKPQKLAMSKIENKYSKNPDIVLIGHYHCSCILPDYMGMYTIQMPCFQSQTPYLGRKGLTPDIGGVILEIEECDGEMISTKTQCINYRPKEEDY